VRSWWLAAALIAALYPGIARAVTIGIDVDPATPEIDDIAVIAHPSQLRVRVTVQDLQAAAPLNAFEIDLRFDGSRLRPLSLLDLDFLPGNTFEVERRIDPNEIGFALAVLGATGATGSGALFEVTFETLGPGRADFDYGTVKLSAPRGVAIAHDLTRASVEILPEASTAGLVGLGFAGLLLRRRLTGSGRQ